MQFAGAATDAIFGTGRDGSAVFGAVEDVFGAQVDAQAAGFAKLAYNLNIITLFGHKT
jgi:hypothetical protein